MSVVSVTRQHVGHGIPDRPRQELLHTGDLSPQTPGSMNRSGAIGTDVLLFLLQLPGAAPHFTMAF